LKLVKVGALKNVSLTTRLQTALDLPRAVWDSARIISAFRPDVMIGVGGYASGPAMLAATLSGVPTLAFEPNFVPGFANRLVAPMVSAAAVHFQETGRYFRKFEVTGVPVRKAFFETAGKKKDGRPTLLVFGGSQGAHAINQAVLESLASLRVQLPDLHIIHQTGDRDYNQAQSAYLAAGNSAEVYAFIDDMPAIFARADVLLCRSGASTAAEVMAAGKPAIFVPFPRAADDHQKRNAEALERAGAALMLEESALTSEKLVDTLVSLFADHGSFEKMASAAHAMAHPNAARQIAYMAARIAGVSSRSVNQASSQTATR
jgi:UDP-N-acetylglucosamine--N-acetylmuramyl-(pentapeptide) pyrophosphoryl-undecaprenol N-acetylglucosamine transferase